MKKMITATVALALWSANLFSQTAGQIKILFDNTHAETSGNTADWCIDADQWNMNWSSTGGYTCSTSCVHSNPQNIPTPSQTAITATTTEDYWTGAISYWAIDCVKKGYWVETLPWGKSITYGNSSNPLDLSHYNIFVVDEPNMVFTTAEKTALMNFITNGGSLFAISDHDGSDRNGDGWDSPAIWNDFFTNNPVQNNAFGYKFALESFSQTSTNVVASASDSITHGTFGTVTKVQWSSGTCINTYTTQNASVKAHAWKTGSAQTLDSTILCVTARYGCGKIASIGDSSPTDDGTGDPSNTNSNLYNGYITDAGGTGNHQKLLMNTIIWLAQPSTCVTGIESFSKNSTFKIYPNPANSILQVSIDNSVSLTNISICDILGNEIIKQEVKNKTQEIIDISSLQNGVYFIRVGNSTQKFIKQ